MDYGRAVQYRVGAGNEWHFCRHHLTLVREQARVEMGTLTNDAGILLIKTFEGLVDGDPDTPGLEPYSDPIGIPTSGFGSIFRLDGRRVRMDDPAITLAQAGHLLERDVQRSERAVARLVDAPLTLNQFSATVCLVYNIGSGNFQASQIRQRLDRRNYSGAADIWWQWRRAGGRILNGLVRRRAAEKYLFLTEEPIHLK